MNKQGIGASEGYAIGKVLIKKSLKYNITDINITDIDNEINRFNNVIQKSKEQIIHIKNKADQIDNGDIFEAHLMLLSDPEFVGRIEETIKEKYVSAEKATMDVTEYYVRMLEEIDDEYLRERQSDIKDIASRIINNLVGYACESLHNVEPNTIIVAMDLTPSDTVEMDRNNVVGFLTDIGGKTSHTAIMARTLEIPAIVGLKDITSTVKDGDTVIIDAKKEIVIINPEEDIRLEYENKIENYKKEKAELKKLVNIKPYTRKGRLIEVYGNIADPKDVDKVIENGGLGIGLFRTEFLYMNRNELPSEEEQYEAYKYVLSKMEDKPVIIRTLDIGGDKQIEYLGLDIEQNPFLGYRGIRFCLDRKDIFKVQLRALIRASIHGKLNIMLPMISSVEEVLEVKELIKQCKQELEEQGHSTRGFGIGIMIEVPSAALIAEELAQYVDFLSIGTNDLIQYTLAADRMNEKISHIYNPSHPAILKLIRMIIEGAHKSGKRCGMCGEMAADEEFIQLLVKYGLDEFSMTPSSILRAKKCIISL